MDDAADAALRPRWRGQPGRLEVWYATATDATGDRGLWVHHELVAPVAGEPYSHGWVALFPTSGPPRVERFGPAPARPNSGWLATEGTETGPGRLVGRAGGVEWDLSWHDETAPVWTFPRRVWERELLPAGQVVGAPSARLHGTLTIDGTPSAVEATGNVAHIYGHGNALRWAWLHADLGDGALLELVTAVSRRRGLSRLPPLAFVQLRHDGADWPRNPALAAVAFRTSLTLPTWTVRGTVGRRRLSVRVTQPADRCVRIGYVDPDGSTALCTNSERADADVRLERWSRGWHPLRAWRLTGTAHAEVGDRQGC